MDYYDKAAVSNSGMSAINPEQGGTPARYKKYVLEKEDEEDTPSLQNGKLIHRYVEEPSTFIVSDVDRPSDMLAGWVEEVKELLDFTSASEANKQNALLRLTALKVRGDRYKSTKDEDKVWEKFCVGLEYLGYLIESDGKLCITPAQKLIVENCVASLHNNPLAQELLFNDILEFGSECHNELPIYWTEDVDGVELNCKALLDRVRVNPRERVIQLIDLKTTSKPVIKFQESFEFYRYYRQMGWYKKALMEWVAQNEWNEEWTIEVYMVVVEVSGIHECKVFRVLPTYSKQGLDEAFNLLDRIAHATKNDDWTTPLEEIGGMLELRPEE